MHKEEGAALVNKSLLSIDYASTCPRAVHGRCQLIEVSVENLETADYLKEGDAGFKKPKASSGCSPIDACHNSFYHRQKRNGLHVEPLQTSKFLSPTAMWIWKSTKNRSFLEHATSTQTLLTMTNCKRPLLGLDGQRYINRRKCRPRR